MDDGYRTIIQHWLICVAAKRVLHMAAGLMMVRSRGIAVLLIPLVLSAFCLKIGCCDKFSFVI
jgi:hypothetical protein